MALTGERCSPLFGLLSRHCRPRRRGRQRQAGHSLGRLLHGCRLPGRTGQVIRGRFLKCEEQSPITRDRSGYNCTLLSCIYGGTSSHWATRPSRQTLSVSPLAKPKTRRAETLWNWVPPTTRLLGALIMLISVHYLARSGGVLSARPRKATLRSTTQCGSMQGPVAASGEYSFHGRDEANGQTPDCSSRDSRFFRGCLLVLLRILLCFPFPPCSRPALPWMPPIHPSPQVLRPQIFQPPSPACTAPRYVMSDSYSLETSLGPPILRWEVCIVYMFEESNEAATLLLSPRTS